MEKKEKKVSENDLQNQTVFDILSGFKEGGNLFGECGSACSRQRNG
jgi:hypothetical protein